MSDRSSINIREFDPHSIYDYASLLFSGAKKTGKSFCARCICWHLRDRVYDCTVFTGSQEENHPWTDYVPSLFVHDNYDEEVLTSAIARQSDRKKIAESYGTKAVGHMIIFEDLEYKKHNIFHDESCRRVLLNGRHDLTFPVVLVQYVMKGLTKEIRGMFDYVFLQKEPDLSIRKKLWTVFGGCCEKFDEFDAIFRMCTEAYGTMVIYLRANSYNVSDNLFWFKSKEMGKYRIGHPDVWRFSEKNSRLEQQRRDMQLGTKSGNNNTIGTLARRAATTTTMGETSFDPASGRNKRTASSASHQPDQKRANTAASTHDASLGELPANDTIMRAYSKGSKSLIRLVGDLNSIKANSTTAAAAATATSSSSSTSYESHPQPRQQQQPTYMFDDIVSLL